MCFHPFGTQIPLSSDLRDESGKRLLLLQMVPPEMAVRTGLKSTSVLFMITIATF